MAELAVEVRQRNRGNMKLFRKRKADNALEWRLDTISNLTRGLGKTEFNNLIDAVIAMYNARQKLAKVKTDDEKEVSDIDEAEKKLEKIRKESK